jgi:predicted TPR repeat methyltransferase
MNPAAELEAQVWARLERGDARAAIDVCERLNREHPDFASGWHTASQLAVKLGNASMALDAIRQARRIEPDNAIWSLQEARCLSRLGLTKDLAAAVQALERRRFATAYENAGLGLLLTELGRRADALRYYERAVQLEPADARHHYNLASLQRTLGDFQKAEENFNKTISLNPADYEAWKLRSELRKQTAEDNHVAELEALLEEGIDDAKGVANVCYALAKELEDLDESGRSFAYLERGASARRRQMQYDLQRDLDTIATIRRVFSRERLAELGPGIDNDEPIFVLGMPRTGTTLVERILGCHSDVQAAGELPDFAVQMMKLVRAQAAGQKMARDDLVELSAEIDYARLGRAYVDNARPAEATARHFVDKLPLNYLYVGLIHAALPNARIIHVQRDPMDTCYAIFKTLFVDAYPFSYDLEEMAHYYVAYRELMAHWHAVLPGVMLSVQYEDLVSDTETESKRLLDYCNLEWQPEVLDFHSSPEASTTASTVQVRQRVYTSSVGRWRDYEQQLQPVVGILREAGIVTET